MYKIVFLDAKTLGDDIDLDKFNQLGELVIFQTTQYNQTIQRLQDADIVITNKVIIDKNIIDNTNLKFIQVAATGMNNVDVEYAKEKNIEVKNVAGYSTNSVVQTTFSFIFHFLQNISYFNNYGLTQWCHNDIFTHIVPFEQLANKTIGIIGLGNIGKKVADISKSFGSEVFYYSTSKTNFNPDYNHLDLNDLLEQCDIISIHAPLNTDTNNLLNKDNLQFLKEGTIVLNLGRGGIVNETDIAEILNSREIYYGTDVTTKEPINCGNPLLSIKDKNKIVITPHIAWASVEARKKLVDTIYENIKNIK